MGASNPFQQGITKFKQALSPKASVLSEGDEGYEESLARWSDTAVRRAKLVVQPADAQDVSKTIKFAIANSISLVVKCGGHSCSGASSSESLVIDLSKHLNKVTVNEEKKLITAGGGALWADVDEAAAKYDLATVGGTVNHTGIGGLTLGGGYGWLSGQHGLVIDVLEEVEIVTANGKIRRASRTENADLFWGLRGYGKGLGVVTTFVYRAFDQPNQVYAGPLIFPGEKLELVVKAVEKYLETRDERSSAFLVFARPEPAGFKPCVIFMVFFNGTEAEGRELLAPLFEVGPIADHTAMVPYKTVNGLQNGMVEHGDRKRSGAANQKNLSLPVLKRAFDKLMTLSEKVPEANGSAMILELFHPKAILDHPRNETAFPWRDDTITIAILVRWKTSFLDPAMAAWMKELQEILFENGDKNHLYSNYSDGQASVTQELAGNYEKLKKLKQKYDPKGVFVSVKA